MSVTCMQQHCILPLPAKALVYVKDFYSQVRASFPAPRCTSRLTSTSLRHVKSSSWLPLRIDGPLRSLQRRDGLCDAVFLLLMPVDRLCPPPSLSSNAKCVRSCSETAADVFTRKIIAAYPSSVNTKHTDKCALPHRNTEERRTTVTRTAAHLKIKGECDCASSEDLTVRSKC